MSSKKHNKNVVERNSAFLGLKIKQFGEKEFKSVVSFSEATGKSTTDLYRYFNGKVIPGADFIRKLQQLGCDINWLLSENSGPPDFLQKQDKDIAVKKLEEENSLLKEEIKNLQVLLKKIENIIRANNISKQTKKSGGQAKL
jgi:DNA-binding transcriptional MerR regulator